MHTYYSRGVSGHSTKTYAIGDPTFAGNLPVHQVMKEAVKEVVDSDNFNGYGPAHGTTVYSILVKCYYY